MPSKIFDIHAPSPLLFRDGKPFGAAAGTETSARSLAVPLPSTLAGFIRTQIGVKSRWDWSNQDVLKNAHTICVSNLLTRDEKIILPAPRDAVIYKDKAQILRIMCLKPLELPKNAGTDLPDGIQPLEVTQDVKPETGYSFWTKEDMTTWLKGETLNAAKLEKIEGLPLETRVHVAIDPKTLVSQEGQLFSVGYRSFESREKILKEDKRYRADSLLTEQYQSHTWGIRTRVKLPENTAISKLGHLGGERRAVALKELGEQERSVWFDCPKELKKAILRSTHLKLILATPAIFEHGWKPAWLERTDNNNMPKGLFGAELELVSAAIGRREPVSGWNIRENSAKAVRYMVPAGSVYFFRIQDGKQEKILENWLKPVSDNEQDRKDGFGLALWGVWK
jgi:CRISPR-associated protein Cmr3